MTERRNTLIDLSDRSQKFALAGLAVGIVGLVIQWIADPAKFGYSFPPGIWFIAAFGLVTILTSRWSFSAVFSVLIAAWIMFGGIATDKLQPNLVSHNLGTVTGNVVMSIGLIVTVVFGIISIVLRLRRRRGRTVSRGPAAG
ncbi:hypothetical protein [Humibacter ginsenosidimutans]|uniref:Uncharacterized protein n=1 Tax=Humibacter ginsenosidimutans TaxID=2599293 RepID=A0A5B8M6K8_9MICO|nr:hypothetical protein [Humibacter ginsenosidimutans]QDZ15976.1 hypothetical protein FPZ11_15430 [Humibacter ginsenosidimutans]